MSISITLNISFLLFQVALLSSTLDTCHKFAQQTLQENKSLKETVRRAEDALTLLQRDNEELRSKNAWHIVGLHGSRLHRTWQGTGAFLRRGACTIQQFYYDK